MYRSVTARHRHFGQRAAVKTRHKKRRTTVALDDVDARTDSEGPDELARQGEHAYAVDARVRRFDPTTAAQVRDHDATAVGEQPNTQRPQELASAPALAAESS